MKTTLDKDGNLTGEYTVAAEGQSDASVRNPFTRSYAANWQKAMENEILAIDPEAAKHKAGASERKIVGDADILLFPDIHAGNLTYKTIVRMAKCKNGNILTGTKSPVILTSRSDTVEVKLNSIALAAVVSEDQKIGII